MIHLLSTPSQPPPPSEAEGEVETSVLRPDKQQVAEKLAKIFGDVLIQRPRQAGKSKRAEEKIRGFLLGFVDY